MDLAPVPPPAADAYSAARARSDGQAKPVGALGRLEDLGAWIAACQGECPPRLLHDVRVVVFAGDHGITDYGVSAYPAAITPIMMRAFLSGHSGVNVLAKAHNVALRVLDMGVADDLEGVPEEIKRFRIGPSKPLHLEDALSLEEVQAALEAGYTVAGEEIAAGADLLLTGDLGIGNTTPSAALVAATLGLGAADVAGRGTGIDDETLAHKIALIDQGIERLGSRRSDPLQRLAALGSADIAAATGFMIGAAKRGVPVLVDGLIAAAEVLMAEELCPGTKAWVRAGHRSPEPGSSLVLEHLGLDPIIDLGMRLGEGTGAVMAVPIVRTAVVALRDVAQLADLMG